MLALGYALCMLHDRYKNHKSSGKLLCLCCTLIPQRPTARRFKTKLMSAVRGEVYLVTLLTFPSRCTSPETRAWQLCVCNSSFFWDDQAVLLVAVWPSRLGSCIVVFLVGYVSSSSVRSTKLRWEETHRCSQSKISCVAIADRHQLTARWERTRPLAQVCCDWSASWFLEEIA